MKTRYKKKAYIILVWQIRYINNKENEKCFFFQIKHYIYQKLKLRAVKIFFSNRSVNLNKAYINLVLIKLCGGKI